MTDYTRAHLEALARGEVVAPEVFDTILRDPKAMTELDQLLRLGELCSEPEEPLMPLQTDVTLEEADLYVRGQLDPDRRKPVEDMFAAVFPPPPTPIPKPRQQTPVIVFLLVRSPEAIASARRGDLSSSSGGNAPEQRWHLEPPAEHRIDTPEGPFFRLPHEVAQGSYTLHEGAEVGLKIDLLLQAGSQAETLEPTVEVSPGPHPGKQPLRLQLRFAEDCIREFVVRPDPLLKKAFARSEAVEPVATTTVQQWSTMPMSAPLEVHFPQD